MRKGQLLLRAWRAVQEPKVTQSQLARRSGMALFRYWQIENGEGPPVTPQEKAAIAEALSIRVSDVAWPDTSTAEMAS